MSLLLCRALLSICVSVLEAAVTWQRQSKAFVRKRKSFGACHDQTPSARKLKMSSSAYQFCI
uniref:Secreted protein n=1 Tax=Physcomitrium patens TaxID=3218 RepID=A0A2K1L0R1_PHYPA|nr:hypothetical protein PHYPA_002411 [Physcomitrium patens]